MAIRMLMVDTLYRPEFPLRYLGEYLIEQSLRFERGAREAGGGKGEGIKGRSCMTLGMERCGRIGQ